MFDAALIARQLHAAITSSRTKCERMNGSLAVVEVTRNRTRTCAWSASMSACVKIDSPTAQAIQPPFACLLDYEDDLAHACTLGDFRYSAKQRPVLRVSLRARVPAVPESGARDMSRSTSIPTA